MPFRQRGSYRRNRGMRPVINSIKNVVDLTASTGTTTTARTIALAKSLPVNTNQSEVQNGCIIKAVWVSIDFCGLAASGVLQRTAVYIIKNPGANLTGPGAFVVGTSNEKKFVFKQWQFMTMRNQDGNPPNHWEGWLRIPKRYQRFGTDDKLDIVFEVDAAAGHFSGQFIYKWYT